jgi:peptidoglycan/xylan/chitin deacetylase (PgdA/CDA1 family)
MPAERRYGLDHPHHRWSPVVGREALRWPNKARVALCVIVNLEHLEWTPPQGSVQPASLYDRPLPDYRNFSHREYGHRVGIFRVLDALEASGIRATVAMDALTAQNYPYLVNHCLGRGSEVIGHGISVSRMITSRMGEEEERGYIEESLKALEDATGKRPQGWLGPEYGESERTPGLLAEAGVRYVCDWANDEQPYAMTTDSGELYSLPIMLELDDIQALWYRKVPAARYGAMLQEAFDVIYDDAASSGRLLVLNLHPWLIGQPHRIAYLEKALESMMDRQGVWAATGSEIINWYAKEAA